MMVFFVFNLEIVLHICRSSLSEFVQDLSTNIKSKPTVITKNFHDCSRNTSLAWLTIIFNKLNKHHGGCFIPNKDRG